MQTRYHVFLLSTYQSKQGALDAVKRTVIMYQKQGYATQYRYSDEKQGYVFVWRSTKLSDNISMAHALGHSSTGCTVNERV
jgi:hypothetical protein